MPSTEENTTLQRIQREISEVMEREKELKNVQPQGAINNNNNENEPNEAPIEARIETRPPLTRAKSAHPVLNGTTGSSNTNGVRLFTSNPSTKGVMHKFIKSRGKLSTVSTLKGNSTPLQHTWSFPDFVEPTRVAVMEPGKCFRKGFVPIEERMRKEFQDYHNREMELKSERRKSQPDFNALLDVESPPQPLSGHGNLRAARSMAQLYDADDFSDEYNSAPSSLKPARSLADLCDATDGELETPGSHSLIMQWENLIQKNQQART